MVSEFQITDERARELSLNPCSCGGWSQSCSVDDFDEFVANGVLILVLVEDGLRV